MRIHPAALILTLVVLAPPALADAKAPAAPAREVGLDHASLDALLKEAVKGARVDYGAVERRRAALKAYLARVASVDATKIPAGPARLAFYTNAYNALVLDAVLESGRPESVLKVPGFFDAKKHTVAGEELTLNALEEKKIRAAGDPRVHFVVNCASFDCPPLAPVAYTAKGWEAALESQTKAFLTRPGEVVIDDEKKTVTVTKLFEWYQGDFGGEAGVRAFLARYLPGQAKKLADPAYSIRTREYDWRLNASKP